MSMQYAHFNSTTLPRREVRAVLRRPVTHPPERRTATKARGDTQRSTATSWVGVVLWSAAFGAVAAVGLVVLHMFGPEVFAARETFAMCVSMSALLGGLGGAISRRRVGDAEPTPPAAHTPPVGQLGASSVPINAHWTFAKPTGSDEVWIHGGMGLEARS